MCLYIRAVINTATDFGNMKKHLVGLAVCALCSTAQAADERVGFYFGVGAGQVSVEIPDFIPGVVSFDESAHIWKGFAGWQFNPYFALEGAFLDADSIDQNYGGGVRATVDGEVLQLSGIGTYWFNDSFEIHGRVSADKYDSRTELDVQGLRLGRQQRRHRAGLRWRRGRGVGSRALSSRLRAGRP
jgi:Outer membrane protein beta-barrel domain